ncbi:DUF5685 family protein [Saccharothrix yanglingensis]|uniref:Regulatory protein n=1 Tax=Saccharothrix yanglingensis TaxID=659496 RepID=A0ABU0X8M7_9PSEU|nr:DUF5685 family protein [Saccharothrix yanglingensis]MDQ2588489.1 hypothetical protein [Saccharothrix yanglingensis]
MFGIIRPCRNRLAPDLRESWLAHLCGLCLALRDDHGHLARVVTNYDGLVISALVEAQSGRSRRSAGPCALRGMRSADVATGTGARLAASVSLVLASAKVGDHVADGDGVFGRPGARGVGRQVARRWAAQAATTGHDLGFDTAVLVDAVARQSSVEAAAAGGTSVLAVTEPTETAAGEAVAQTAVLTGRPGNAAPLREVGRLFGRLAHLLDAVEDLAEDRASGAWNPLVATGTSLEEARRLCEDAALGIRLAMAEVEFADDRLVHVLLVHEVRESIGRAFGEPHVHTPGHTPPPGWQPGPGMYDPYHQGGVAPPPPVPPASAPGRGGPPTPPKGGRRKRGDDPAGSGSGLWAWPKLRQPPVSRGLLTGCLAVLYQCGTCQYCCRDPYPGAWSGKWREAWCNCDCSGCDGCCTCCDCSC